MQTTATRFPAIRGIQAGRPFYIATCPMRIIPKFLALMKNDVPQVARATHPQ